MAFRSSLAIFALLHGLSQRHIRFLFVPSKVNKPDTREAFSASFL